MSSALDVTESSWQTAVLDSKTPVLVDFWAPWCGPCKMMGPSVDQLSAELAGKLKVVKLNTQEDPSVAARYGIMSIPCFVLLKGGEVVGQLVGAMQYGAFRDWVSARI